MSRREEKRTHITQAGKCSQIHPLTAAMSHSHCHVVVSVRDITFWYVPSSCPLFTSDHWFISQSQCSVTSLFQLLSTYCLFGTARCHVCCSPIDLCCSFVVSVERPHHTGSTYVRKGHNVLCYTPTGHSQAPASL